MKLLIDRIIDAVKEHIPLPYEEPLLYGNKIVCDNGLGMDDTD